MADYIYALHARTSLTLKGGTMMLNQFSDYEKKFVLHISHNIPYSRAEFFTALKQFEDAGVELSFVDKTNQIIATEHVIIFFKG